MRKLSAIIAIACILAICASAHAGVTTRVSVSSSGEQGNDHSWWSSAPAISADGRYVAFSSLASNLVSVDTNRTWDVFVRDTVLGTAEQVSVSTNGAQGNDYSGYYGLSISPDGRYVAFNSRASNLVSGDTNGYTDIFVRDRVLGTTERVSLSATGEQANGDSGACSISADGRYVAFSSSASNLVQGDANGTRDVFVRDRLTGQTMRVSVASDGAQSNPGGDSNSPYCCPISADGRYVAFASRASDLVQGDADGSCDVFVHDRQTGDTTIVSAVNDPAQGAYEHGWAATNIAISGDGRYVAFESCIWWNGGAWTGGCVFVHDRQTGQTTSVFTGGCYAPAMSADGRYVAFWSSADLVPGDTNGYPHAFVRDMLTGTTERVSLSTSGEQGNSHTMSASVSADGRFVAFASWASNLVPGNTNGYCQIFVRDRWGTGTPPPEGSGPGWEPPPSTTFSVRNPYAGYTPARKLKGQLHSHYYQDGNGWGSITPKQLIEDYADQLGYDFVCVTEHYHCTTDPLVSSPTYIRYCEEVTKDFAHVLALGINHTGCPNKSSGPGGDESRYRPWDSEADSNGLCEVEQFASSNLQQVVSKIGEWGGAAILAHPNGPAAPEPDKLLGANGLSAISIYTAANNWPVLGGVAYTPFAAGKWDWLLGLGKETDTPNGPMRIFCATEDDFTPRICYGAFGRTWIVADVTSANPTQGDILDAAKRGRYWAYWSKSRHYGTGPLLSLSVSQEGTLPVINVTCDTNLDEIQFYGATNPPSEGPLPGGPWSGTSASYTCNGTEKYVRVEARKDDIHIYSQAISIDWDTGQVGSGMAVTGKISHSALAATPSDIVYMCALPDLLPAKMPPLGYIGRAYSVSTTSGNYPPGATFTLSYEGIDVTPYGASNLAIYRWDSASLSWAKLDSTVDIGNALVTAPLTEAGLYTISAEVIGDAAAPTASIHSPSPGATLTGPDVIGVQASDNVGVLRVSFYLNDQCIGVDSTGFDGYTCEFDFGRKSAGPYTLKVAVEDVSGNTGEAEVDITIASSGVTPVVAITSPTNGASLEGTVSVTGTCGDDSLVTGVFVLADGIPVGEAQITGGAWTFSLDTSLLANGPHTLSAMVMDENQNTSEQGIGVTVSGVTLDNLAEVKSLADGERARLSGRVVTFGAPGHEGAFYIEELDRFSGIRVEGSLLPAEGDMVSASGVMSTVGGERALVGADVLTLSSSNPLPPPLGMINRNLGGGSFGLYVPGITGGFGLNNIGLLVTTWGRVTQIGDGCLYIDDGSNLLDGTLTGGEENIGVRVICDPAGYESGDYLVVTGISSCFETPSGQIARRILTRKPEDVRKPGE
ncbi:MAG TPA: Ig-like domain-containing protein [Armatimonadota bacterium]|nr:Ig-like domain-containing protein [Armatimonadota bacterium]